jgi:hypothetical protein
MFFVLTDHKPLTLALHRVTEAWSALQQQQLAYIAEYTSDLKHGPGSSKVVADELSCPAAAVAMPALACVDFAVLAATQARCEDTQKLALSSSLRVAGACMLCDMSTGVLILIVLANQQHAVFEAMHWLAHPGTRALHHIIMSWFV